MVASASRCHFAHRRWQNGPWFSTSTFSQEFPYHQLAHSFCLLHHNPCKQPKGKGPPVLLTCGKTRRQIGTLTPTSVSKPMFAQLYFPEEPDDELEPYLQSNLLQNKVPKERRAVAELANEIKRIVMTYNALYKELRTAFELFEQLPPQERARVQLTLTNDQLKLPDDQRTRVVHPKTYSKPTDNNQVIGIVPTKTAVSESAVVITHSNSRLRTIPVTSKLYMTAPYPSPTVPSVRGCMQTACFNCAMSTSRAAASATSWGHSMQQIYDMTYGRTVDDCYTGTSLTSRVEWRQK